MSDQNEQIEMSEQDIIDVEKLANGEQPTFHPILEVFREVLKPARNETEDRVTAAFANKIVSSYQEVTFAQMNTFRNTYYDLILDLEAFLTELIVSDEECLAPTTPEEDAEQNARHYRTLILGWQKIILRRELAWDCTDPDAGVELAALSEVHKMFFSPTGLIAYLDNIPFQFTDEDRAELAAELEAMKAGDGE